MNDLAQSYAVPVLAFSAMSKFGVRQLAAALPLAACCRPCFLQDAERWNRLFPKPKMTEQQQADRIRAWLAQDGKACPRLDRGIANMRERLWG